MKKKIRPNRTGFALALCATAGGLLALPLFGENPSFAQGDLMLYFQQEGGDNTLYVNLGSAATVFRGTASGADVANIPAASLPNIGTALAGAFGPNWRDDPTVFVGLAASWSQTTGTTLLLGDPERTIYVSSPRNSVGTLGQPNSVARNVAADASMTTAATNIIQQGIPFDDPSGAFGHTDPIERVTKTNSQIDERNPFFSAGTLGTAFGVFTGGVMQKATSGAIGTFGPAGEVEFALDLYRILARGTGGTPPFSAPVAGQVAGPVRQGTYEGTITIDQNGNLSFVAQAETTPTLEITGITKSATTVTITYDSGGTAVDLYRSIGDLDFSENDKVTTDGGDGTVQDLNAVSPKAFYRLVPEGGTP